MKLDKETVVKHQFWFLLGGYLFVWFIAVLWLKLAAGGPIQAAQGKYKTANDKLNTAKQNPINVSKVLPPWKKQADEFDGFKNVIWNKAWNLQGAMYDWSEKLKDMTTPQTELTDDDRSHYQHVWYKAEVDQLRSYIVGTPPEKPGLLNPIELQGGFDRIFQAKVWTETPTREEMWLVQEDFWVKRELFFVLWKAMAEQAFMPEIPIDETKEPLPKDVKARYRYRNQNWELTLHIRESEKGLVVGGDSTIKNVGPSRRTQTLTSATGGGIRFYLSQHPNRPPTPFEISGEPVPPGEPPRKLGMEKDQGREDYPVLDGIDWSEKAPVYVSQAFDTTNCPIRRLNQIALTKKDCRTHTWALLSNQTLARLDAAPEDPTVKPPAAPSGGPRGGGGMAGMPPMVPPGGGPNAKGPGAMGGAPAAVENLTPNNSINRDRYLRPPKLAKGVNPPSRHLPFAIQLIVEQSHLHDVQMAMANSRLRIEITQVEFHHVKDYTPQSEDDKKGSPDRMGRSNLFAMPGMPNMGAPMPGRPASGSRGRRGGMRMPTMPSPTMRPPGGAGMNIAMLPSMKGRGPVPGIGANADPKQPAAKASDDNLVQVTLYGIATLYRLPDPPKAQPAAPAGPQRPGPNQPPAAPQPNEKQPPAAAPAAPDKPAQPAGKQPEPKPAATTPTTPKNDKR